MTDQCIICYVSAPPSSSALIAKSLIEKRIAACVSIIPRVTSIYEWNGAINTDTEDILMIKSQKALFGDIKDSIVKLHPYEVPEIIVVDILNGSQTYLDWVIEQTTPQAK